MSPLPIAFQGKLPVRAARVGNEDRGGDCPDGEGPRFKRQERQAIRGASEEGNEQVPSGEDRQHPGRLEEGRQEGRQEGREQVELAGGRLAISPPARIPANRPGSGVAWKPVPAQYGHPPSCPDAPGRACSSEPSRSSRRTTSPTGQLRSPTTGSCRSSRRCWSSSRFSA